MKYFNNKGLNNEKLNQKNLNSQQKILFEIERGVFKAINQNKL